MPTSKKIQPVKYVSALQGAIQAKCPRCRRGDIFASSTYSFTGQKMHENCSHCGLHYEREPGYWYVSMFVSYAFNVAEMVTLAVATYLLTGSHSPWLYVGILLGIIFLLSPFNYRYSRVVLLYWLTPGLNYNESYAEDRQP
ncbi:DUF983 domain-containing protein [Mucilaginibacter segetis]|uniref:DUF983 domain-containing protein n=1 Tax=Mucilaginibacter segetis TaxID=2793071 RepID=A0A934PST0_9SPHI|nr:DUF983 domain-containing protein [Mucilaginibacter segetis]MBK0378313.1 DUF983 domain-containing protein [Mucilaginibacter segetis]